MSEMVKVTVEVRKDHYNTLKYGVKHWPENYDENEKAIANGTEVKQGRWINRHHIAQYRTFDTKICNQCGFECSYDAETGIGEYNYCPNCGAEMRGKTDEYSKLE